MKIPILVRLFIQVCYVGVNSGKSYSLRYQRTDFFETSSKIELRSFQFSSIYMLLDSPSKIISHKIRHLKFYKLVSRITSKKFVLQKKVCRRRLTYTRKNRKIFVLKEKSARRYNNLLVEFTSKFSNSINYQH